MKLVRSEIQTARERERERERGLGIEVEDTIAEVLPSNDQ
jgi:hypothetical protein